MREKIDKQIGSLEVGQMDQKSRSWQQLTQPIAKVVLKSIAKVRTF